VTNAMQGLVRELNSEIESNDEDEVEAGRERLALPNAWDNETYGSHSAGLLVGLEQDEDETEADLNTVLNNNKKILSMEKFMNQHQSIRSPYSASTAAVTTPVMFRKNSKDTTTRLLQRQMQLNGVISSQNKVNANGKELSYFFLIIKTLCVVFSQTYAP
jgi:hypothetical protein